MKQKKVVRLHFIKGLILNTLKVFILLLICFVISRCAKDRLVSNVTGLKPLSASSPDLANRLLAMKNSYDELKLHQKLQPNLSDKLTWTPDWDNPTIQVVNDTVSYVFFRLIAQVEQGGKSFVATEMGAASYLMVKNEQDFYKAFYFRPNLGVNNVASLKKLDIRNFSGNLLLTNLKDGKNFLLDYLNGKVSEAYEKKKVLSINKLALNRPPTTSYWESQCRYEMRECTYVSSGTVSCGGTYGFEIVYSENCNFPSPVCGVDFWLSDYADREVCVDVWFPDPPTDPGNGGTPGDTGGTTEPSIEVKQDSLAKHYPCMAKEVLNKLAGNDAFAKLVQPFQKIILPNGTTLAMQGLPNLKYDFSTQDYGVGTSNYSLGTTGDYAGTSSTIRFNTEAMANASQLLLQATAIHETGHAYANYYIKAGQYGVPVDTTRYSTWAINIVNFESVAKSSAQGGGNFNDHSIFLEEYFENFWGILKAVNGTAYTDKEYQMAALFGLNNPGPAPQSPIVNGLNVYEIYKGMLTASFNRIKTKYGITDAELNTFNLANLKNVPANKKLPTTCP